MQKLIVMAAAQNRKKFSVSNMDKGQKRLFLALGLFTLFVYGGIFTGVWLLMVNAPEIVKSLLLTALIAAVVCGMIGLFGGLCLLTASLMMKHTNPYLERFGKTLVSLFYPLVNWMGQLIGVEKDAIGDSFIKINNQITRSAVKPIKPGELLLLAPLCLQNHECPYKLTVNVHACKRCGKCPVKDLLDLEEETGVKLVLASGGTFARKFIKELQPKAVVAIVCEKDLISGIKDMNEVNIPVIGVLNERPNGPCHNTNVQLSKVRQAITEFTEV